MADAKPAEKTRRGTFTIGKATTYVTGPVDANGHIDYAAALNEQMSRGVTPENNANVLIWKALGPTPVGTVAPPGLFEKLGMPAPPAEGDYFIRLCKYMGSRGGLGTEKAATDTLTRLGSRPWSASDAPQIADWLKVNEKPLALVVEAASRTHFYSPLIPGRGEQGSNGLWSSQLPGIQACRELAQALTARAMLRVAHEDTDGAWKDLLACHRLGRLLGQTALLIEGLVGIAIEVLACRADVAFLESSRPDATKLSACIRDLRALPTRRSVAEQIDMGERFAFLDIVMTVDRQGLAAFRHMSSDPSKPATPWDDSALTGIDWNPGLESANRWYDQIVAALRQNERPARLKKLDQHEADFLKLQNSLRGGGHGFALHSSEVPADARGSAFGDLFIVVLSPAARKVQDAHERGTQIFENTVTAFALARYHREHRRYPDDLDELTPRYLPSVPKDLFSGRDLIYTANRDDFLLYSVGINGKDDGGIWSDDRPNEGDIGVRMPLPTK